MDHQPSIDIRLYPEPKEAYEFLKDAIKQKDTVLLLASCSVEYEGRGASRLGQGDRLVIIKRDGAVLVHRPTGYSPVNWQPESHVINIDMDKDIMIVRSIRKRPKEILTIFIHKVYLVARAKELIDDADFIEYLDEREISDYIAENPDIIEEGLHVISRERRIGEGYADIIARDKKGNYVVIEVKRVTATKDAVKQLFSYVEELRKANPNAPVRGILVAPSATKDAVILAQSLGLEFKQIDIVRIYRDIRSKKRPRASKSLLEYFGGTRKEK
ncbi:endonuclease NucS [Pyrofollis japonicus]|uniref:endonuclease NucS n=1 Tax=Pyrofollis japonicus TaxID=3060460 RepID=UPI00295BF202|nr:endonuclease NucS [Pyrofollis japonicus]BEP17678.1 endonuclease NucS [Pyrofollis japonicus]